MVQPALPKPSDILLCPFNASMSQIERTSTVQAINLHKPLVEETRV